jgi:hypothetical protein
MNERRYLMEGEDISKLEPAITNWINAMNAVYGTQMKLGKSGTNGGKVPQGCETVMKDPSIITKANAMNTAYDNLVRLVTPAQ